MRGQRHGDIEGGWDGNSTGVTEDRVEKNIVLHSVHNIIPALRSASRDNISGDIQY